MKRLVGQTLTLVAIATVVSALTPACTDNDGSIYIQQVMAPPQSRTNGICTYTADRTQPSRSAGTLDVAITKTYTAEMLVGNQMVPRGDSNAPRGESNRIHINGVIVRVTDANGNAVRDFTSPTAGFVDPASGSTPNFGLIEVSLIDPGTIAKIGVDKSWGAPNTKKTEIYIANVKAFGKTTGGVDVESAEFSYPIRVGWANLNNGICTNPPTVETTAPCVAGVDEPYGCLRCPDGNGGSDPYCQENQ